MNKSIGETGGEEASSHSFGEALSVIGRRFAEAVSRQARTPEFRHIMNDRYPGVVVPLGSFMLAQSYEQAIEGRGDNFEIAVPINEARTDAPEMRVEPDLDKAFFILDFKRDDQPQSIVVTEANYQELFIDNPQPPIPDLPYKLSFYQVIPSRRPTD